MRKEFASLQSLLAQRESELTQLRTNHELDRERWTTEARFAVQKADHVWQAEDAEEAEQTRRLQTTIRLVRDGALAIAFLGLAMFGYFRLAPMLANSPPAFLQPILDQVGIARVQPQMPPALRPAQPVTAPSAPAVMQPSLLVTHGANLRAGPSSTAAVLGVIPRDAKVTSIEKQGSWTHIRYAKGTDKPLEGWLFTSFLQASGQAADKKPAAASP